ncbi:MAG: YdcF family protein [Magnetospirillum gryphiswaldense]|nr:YdcF family protein [Magnetospirillum gryphiswaldense]
MIVGTKHPQIAACWIDSDTHSATLAHTFFYKGSRMFVLSKLFGILSSATNVVLLCLLAVSLLGYTPWRRHQRWLLALGTALLLVIAVLPWKSLLIQPLEDRFVQASLPDDVAGIVVLGGALDPVVSAARDQVSANGAVERVTSLVTLGRRYPQARLIFSGGSGSLTTQDLKEAPVARRFLDELGFDTSRVVFEDQSRNTRENATFSMELMEPKPGETWLLVTSALHMPRSMGAFRAAGWTIQPYPVDYVTSGRDEGLGFDLGGALSKLDVGMHEWLGLAYYRLRGWSDSLFPAP